jgi:Zn-finger nucleic acid-binding protein
LSRLAQDDKKTTTFLCPSCRQPLLETLYERTQLYQCHFCGGVLAENNKLSRIMARAENSFSDRITSLSKAVMMEKQAGQIGRSSKNIGPETRPLRSCPKCKNQMTRTFYTLAYRVEIDRCSFCGLTWFDHDEIEMLQCMIVNKMAAEPPERKTA